MSNKLSALRTLQWSKAAPSMAYYEKLWSEEEQRAQRRQREREDDNFWSQLGYYYQRMVEQAICDGCNTQTKPQRGYCTKSKYHQHRTEKRPLVYCDRCLREDLFPSTFFPL